MHGTFSVENVLRVSKYKISRRQQQIDTKQ